MFFIKKIRYFLYILAIFYIGYFFNVSQALASDSTLLEINFSAEPLFSQELVVPGEKYEALIKLKNLSDSQQQIAMASQNINDSSNLSQFINFKILADENILYNSKLKDFFEAGEIYLNDLNSLASSNYQIIVDFDKQMSNDCQGGLLNFDLLVGFLGEEPKQAVAVNFGQVGGGGFSQNNVIAEESIIVTDILQDQVVISWLTSQPSTSQVVYSLASEAHSFNLEAENFGYAYAWPVPEDPQKVTYHQVVLTNLKSNSIYYYRCISRASPVSISYEHLFKTANEEILIPDQHALKQKGDADKLPIVKGVEEKTLGSLITDETGGVSTIDQSDELPVGQVAGEKEIVEEQSEVVNQKEQKKPIIWLWVIIIIVLVLFIYFLLLKKN